MVGSRVDGCTVLFVHQHENTRDSLSPLTQKGKRLDFWPSTVKKESSMILYS